MDRADLEQWKAREVARLLALVETERRYYQEIIASIPVGLLVLTTDLSIVSSNRAIKRIFGLRGGDSVRGRLDSLLPSWILDRARDVLTTGVAQLDMIAETEHRGGRRLRVAILAIRNWEDEDEQEALIAIEDITDLEPAAPAFAPAAVEEEKPAVEASAEEKIEEKVEERTETEVAEPSGHLETPAETPAEAPEPVEIIAALPVESAEPISAPAPEPAPVPAEAEPGLPASELIANLDAMVWAVEVPGMHFLFVSPQVESILGYPAAHWIDTEDFWKRRAHEADRDAVAQSYDRLIADPARFNEKISCEYRALTADGSVRWLRETARVLTDGEGHARYIIGIAFDITERRQLEDQLVQAQRVDAVGKLASRMAHDLNNMLMIVTGYGEELLHGIPTGSPSRADVQEIIGATERLAGLTQQLLAFTRKQAQPGTTVELSAVIDAMESELRDLLGDRIELEVVSPTEPIAVTADAAQLAQVISAFAHHAHETMPDGGTVTLEISRTEITEEPRRPELPLRPGSYGIVTFRDTAAHKDGEGRAFFESLPPKEALDDPSRSLSRAYSVVRQWGGDVSVASAPARGNIFRIYLPLMELEHVEPVETLLPEPQPEPEPEPVPPAPEPVLETILVVEDEGGIRALVRKILRRQGYDVIEATGAEEALRLCKERSGKIDLLITDVVMPDIGGRELVRKLQEVCKTMKVLYVSGYTDDPDLYSGELPPGTAFLQKPFTLGSLLDKVKEVLAAKID